MYIYDFTFSTSKGGSNSSKDVKCAFNNAAWIVTIQNKYQKVNEQ